MTIDIKGPHGASKTTITIDSSIIYTSRIISNKLCSLLVNVDGTIEDLLTKTHRVAELVDEDYIEFSRIYKESLND